MGINGRGRVRPRRDRYSERSGCRPTVCSPDGERTVYQRAGGRTSDLARRTTIYGDIVVRGTCLHSEGGLGRDGRRWLALHGLFDLARRTSIHGDVVGQGGEADVIEHSELERRRGSQGRMVRAV